ncbi:MAG: AbrB/MazE/SpoVT family DNA-binding domain-containing protein [Candidatus Natronoplasma sp.]
MISIRSKMGERGQVVIPKPIRDMFDLKAGGEVSFKVEDDKIIIEAKKGDDILEDYLSEIEKMEEPDEIDWDEKYYSQLGG